MGFLRDQGSNGSHLTEIFLPKFSQRPILRDLRSLGALEKPFFAANILDPVDRAYETNFLFSLLWFNLLDPRLRIKMRTYLLCRFA